MLRHCCSDTVKGAAIIGRADIATFESSSFANGLQIEYTHHATRLLSPTTAISHGSQVVTSATPPVEGHAVYAWVKVGSDPIEPAVEGGGR